MAARRLLVCVDAKGYSGNDDRGQFSMQGRLLAVLDEAAGRVGLTRLDWLRQSAGDGELGILPESEPEPVVVDKYVRELGAVLAEHNHDLVERAHLRLRLGIHHGIAFPADNGFAGRGVIVVSRLVDSRPVRQALVAAPAANLAVILSARVFEDMIVQRATSFTAKEFRRVKVVNKELDEDAWLYVAGVDVHTLDLAVSTDSASPNNAPPDTAAGHPASDPDDGPAAAGGPVTDQSLVPLQAVTHTTIHGNVAPTGGTTVIGNNLQQR